MRSNRLQIDRFSGQILELEFLRDGAVVERVSYESANAGGALPVPPGASGAGFDALRIFSRQVTGYDANHLRLREDKGGAEGLLALDRVRVWSAPSE